MSQRLHISIADNLFIWLKKKAAKELRSVNNYITSLIDKEKKKEQIKQAQNQAKK